MNKGGKHLSTEPRKRGSGAHLSRRELDRKQQRRGRMRTGVPQMLVMLVLCALMISPLRSCIIDDSAYIGYAAAREAALDDAGIAPDKAQNVTAEMIKIDDTVCYKVQFTGTATDYIYIINASSGDIIAQKFFRLEG